MFGHSLMRWAQVVPWLLLAASAASAQVDSQAALIKQAKQTLASMRPQIAKIGDSLAKNSAAHVAFRTYVDRPLPDSFIRRLTNELAILQQLMKGHEIISDLVDAANGLAAGQRLDTSVHVLSGQLSQMDDGLREVQTHLQSRQSVRKEFKASLDQIVNALIAANPADAGTLISIRVHLDPNMLDQDLGRQRSILSSTIIACNFLK